MCSRPVMVPLLIPRITLPSAALAPLQGGQLWPFTATSLLASAGPGGVDKESEPLATTAALLGLSIKCFTIVAALSVAAIAAALAAIATWLAWEQYVLSLRQQRHRGHSAIPASSSAYVEPREVWRRSDLAAYDGRQSPEGWLAHCPFSPCRLEPPISQCRVRPRTQADPPRGR